jgi:hypothetical protein
MKRRYKRLDVPNWATWPKRLKNASNNPINNYEPCEKVFNKNGWYYDRLTKKSWIEWEDICFVYESDTFLYELLILNAKRLTDAELEAIAVLNIYGVKNDRLNSMAKQEEIVRMLRRTVMRSKIARKRILGRW